MQFLYHLTDTLDFIPPDFIPRYDLKVPVYMNKVLPQDKLQENNRCESQAVKTEVLQPPTVT